MGVLRTINHPGIQINEVDASGATEQVGGCTSLVVGFFPQGESATPVNPTSLKSVQSYFGTPENEAERYAYYACKSVFDNGGKLIAARIPYENNSQYLTPAVKYNIKEWSTEHDIDYKKDSTATNYTHKFNYLYNSSEVTGDDKNDFHYGTSGSEVFPNVNNSLEIVDYKINNGITDIETHSSNVYSIKGKNSGRSATEYYEISMNKFVTTNEFTIGDSSVVVSGSIDDYNGDFASEGVSGEFTVINLSLQSSSFVKLNSQSFTTSENVIYFTDSSTTTILGKIEAVKNSDKLTGVFKLYSVNDEDGYDQIGTITNLIYQKTIVSVDGFEINPVAFSGPYDSFYTITKKTAAGWDGGTTNSSVAESYYTETKVDNDTKIRDFTYDDTTSTPTTAFVTKLTEDIGGTSVMVIKEYTKSGESGTKTILNTSDTFTELRIWDATKITDVTSLTQANSAYFDIIVNEYCGSESSTTTRVSDSEFVAVPITADVTEGYVSPDGVVTSENINIEYGAAQQPIIDTVDDPNGTGKIKVLTRTKTNVDVNWNANDYYRFVSPYKTVQDVANAHSDNYNWIHYTTNSSLTASGDYQNRVLLSCTFGCETSAVPDELSKIENIVTIIPQEEETDYGYIKLSDYIDYRDDAKKVDENTIVIANITEQKFGVDSYNNLSETENGEEVLGIVPVIMSGFQALPRQSRIEIPGSINNAKIFNALESIVRGQSMASFEGEESSHVDVSRVVMNNDGFVKNLGNVDSYNPYESTYSNDLLAKVPSINLNSSYKPNGKSVNMITLVVCRLSISAVNDNKVMLTVLESFTGSLDSTLKDEKGNSIFIDNIVNSAESGSAYVKLFSNYKNTIEEIETRTISRRQSVHIATNDNKVTVVVPKTCGTAKWWIDNKRMNTIGFTDKQTKKYISYATMVAAIENVFDTLSNIDEEDIDIVVDAGLTSIANRIKKYIDENPEETKAEYDLTFDEIKSVQDVAGWKSMAAKLITFCQTTRKDCMALIDSPRSLCVKNNVKLIDCKKTSSTKYSIDYDILPKFNYLGGLNSSYGAGFCNWILAVDDYSAKNVWMPPSIAAEGNIIYTDYNSNYWMAPAGEKRGNILWAVDVAFNPNAEQQDSIYSKNWNYAISSSGNIMTWGQKTFLSTTSSFNRINVRRLFLRLERLTRKNSKWVLFELNNQKTRNTYVDRIDPIFANVKAMGGVYDYKIIADETTNKPDVIQDNTFRACFLIKPSIAIDYVILTFFNLNNNMEWSEVYGDL